MSELRPTMLRFLAAFANGLSHKMRTPLSVISNDLSYFETKIDPSECERSKRRCRELSELLKELSLSNIETQTSLDCQILVETLTTRGAGVAGSPSCTLTSLGDSLLHAFVLLDEFLAELDDGRRYSFSLKGSTLSISVPVGTEPPADTIQTATLTEYLQEKIGVNSHIPPYVETIFLAHGIKTKLNANKNSVIYTILTVATL